MFFFTSRLTNAKLLTEQNINGGTTVEKEYFEVRVAAGSNVKNLAGMIATIIRGTEKEAPRPVKLCFVGASAGAQALKSVAIARGHVAVNGLDLVCRPGFSTVKIENEEKTAMNLYVERA